jgi:hypothetical protein
MPNRVKIAVNCHKQVTQISSSTPEMLKLWVNLQKPKLQTVQSRSRCPTKTWTRMRNYTNVNLGSRKMTDYAKDINRVKTYMIWNSLQLENPSRNILVCVKLWKNFQQTRLVSQINRRSGNLCKLSSVSWSKNQTNLSEPFTTVDCKVLSSNVNRGTKRALVLLVKSLWKFGQNISQHFVNPKMGMKARTTPNNLAYCLYKLQ